MECKTYCVHAEPVSTKYLQSATSHKRSSLEPLALMVTCASAYSVELIAILGRYVVISAVFSTNCQYTHCDTAAYYATSIAGASADLLHCVTVVQHSLMNAITRIERE